MRRALFLSFALPLLGCGGADPKPVATPHADPPPVAAKPRCPPDADDQPSDAAAKMNGLQREIRHCFALGASTKEGTAVVQVKLTVASDGSVKELTLPRADGSPDAVACTEKLFRSTTFATFCGEDVPISWTYTIH